MTELKPISSEAIPKALEKVERYRLLNEPAEAESICRDVLRVNPGHQQALVMLLLTLTDQFRARPPRGVNEARAVLEQLEGEYERVYYDGIICERQGKAQLQRATPGSESSAHDWLRAAMRSYERAERIRPAGNDDALLRWNACARLLRDRQLVPRPEDTLEHPIE